jgi:intein-encoded DNA endonuclease-like protein
MGFTREQVEEIAAQIKAMPKVEPPPKDLTKQEVVKALSKEIKSLRTKGYTMEQIAMSLKGFGLDISTPTLRSYLQNSKRKPKKTVDKKNNSHNNDDDSSTSSIEEKSGSKVDDLEKKSTGSFKPKADRGKI